MDLPGALQQSGYPELLGSLAEDSGDSDTEQHVRTIPWDQPLVAVDQATKLLSITRRAHRCGVAKIDKVRHDIKELKNIEMLLTSQSTGLQTTHDHLMKEWTRAHDLQSSTTAAEDQQVSDTADMDTDNELAQGLEENVNTTSTIAELEPPRAPDSRVITQEMDNIRLQTQATAVQLKILEKSIAYIEAKERTQGMLINIYNRRVQRRYSRIQTLSQHIAQQDAAPAANQAMNPDAQGLTTLPRDGNQWKVATAEKMNTFARHPKRLAKKFGTPWPEYLIPFAEAGLHQYNAEAINQQNTMVMAKMKDFSCDPVSDSFHQQDITESTNMVAHHSSISQAEHEAAQRNEDLAPELHAGPPLRLIFYNFATQRIGGFRATDVVHYVELLPGLGNIFVDAPQYFGPGSRTPAVVRCSVLGMTDYVMKMLRQRYILRNGILMMVRAGCHRKDDPQDQKFHGMAELTQLGRDQAATFYPDKAQDYYEERGIHLVLAPDGIGKQSTWERAITEAGRFEVTFKSHADVIRFDELEYRSKHFLIANYSGLEGESTSTTEGVIRSTALGPFHLDILYLPLNVERRSLEGLLTHFNIGSTGTQDDTAVPYRGTELHKYARSSVYRIGFDSEVNRMRACQNIHGQYMTQISDRALQCSFHYRVPKGSCFTCFHPEEQDRALGHTAKNCPNRQAICSICKGGSHRSSDCGATTPAFRMVHRSPAAAPSSAGIDRTSNTSSDRSSTTTNVAPLTQENVSRLSGNSSPTRSPSQASAASNMSAGSRRYHMQRIQQTSRNTPQARRQLHNARKAALEKLKQQNTNP